MKARSGISANGLKWIAILAMIIDHLAWKMPETLPGWTAFAAHFVGRLTMATMGFFIAEGFRYTRDRKKYALRLLVSALIAQIPYNYFGTGNPFSLAVAPAYFNVLFTLLLGLCALWALKSEWKLWMKILLALLCVFASILCDWPLFGVLFILAFGLNTGSFKRQALWFSLAAAIQIVAYMALADDLPFFSTLGIFLVLLPLAFYNGKKSGPRAPAWATSKWTFYIIFPLQYLVLAFLHYGLGWLK